MNNQDSNVQLVWGIALLIAGLGVYYQIPYKMAQMEASLSSSALMFAKICFYLMGTILAGGGLKKIYTYFRPSRNENSDGD